MSSPSTSPGASPPAARPPMMSLDEAVARLVEMAGRHRITEQHTVPTMAALGRVLAQAVSSTLDVPPADNSAMDGYAMCAADVPAPGTVLHVSQRIPAGVVGQPLQPGTAARIFTGAQVPPGADVVVMQEQCEAIAGQPGTLGQVRVQAVPEAGQFVRRRGEDVRRDAVVLAPGVRLNPQALGLAASVGAGSLAVLRRPRVALFSTGDELVMPGDMPPDQMPPGAIYNSNRFTLKALLEAAGCEVDDLGIVVDKLEATREALKRAALGNDLILTCGGVSVGEEDHLKPAALAEGRLDLWQIAIKPGKPLAFGAIRRGGADARGGETLLVGLPGNPVSAFVTYLLAVAPVLRALQGLPQGPLLALPLQADFDWPRADKRREFLRARLTPAGTLELYPNQSSGVLTSTVWADGLIDNPAGQAIAKGDTVRFLPLATLVMS